MPVVHNILAGRDGKSAMVLVLIVMMMTVIGIRCWIDSDVDNDYAQR